MKVPPWGPALIGLGLGTALVLLVSVFVFETHTLTSPPAHSGGAAKAVGAWDKVPGTIFARYLCRAPMVAAVDDEVAVNLGRAWVWIKRDTLQGILSACGQKDPLPVEQDDRNDWDAKP